jgi:hypothetical protein
LQLSGIREILPLSALGHNLQGQLLRMLEFYHLADPATIHPSQLLAAVLPSLLSPAFSESASSLLEAARSCVRATAAAECPSQSADVAVALDAAMSQRPSDVMELLGGLMHSTRRQSSFTSQASMGTGVSTGDAVLPVDAAALDEGRSACRALADELGRVLERSCAGAAGAAPGSERFSGLRASLAAAGELYPLPKPGLLGLEEEAVAQGAEHSPACAPPVAAKCGSTTRAMSGRPLNVLDWAKAGQIWLLQLAGAQAELDAVCHSPGVWGSATGCGVELCQEGCALIALLVKQLRHSGQASAAGLLLRAVGRPRDALAEWLEEFDCSREASLNIMHGLEQPPSAPSANTLPPISECRTLVEHVAAFAALPGGAGAPSSGPALVEAARALLAAARASETMCDCGALPELSDDHVSWLLRMPSQCALAVLCARDGVDSEDLFSPYHGLGVEGSECEGDGDDASQLWLQVRYMRVCAARAPDDGEAWGVYLTQLARLVATGAAACAPVACAAHGTAPCHAVYGPQEPLPQMLLEESWMSEAFIAALRHPDASAAVSALLEPLRPVTCTPVATFPPHEPLVELFLSELPHAPATAIEPLDSVIENLSVSNDATLQPSALKRLCVAVLEADGSEDALMRAVATLLPPPLLGMPEPSRSIVDLKAALALVRRASNSPTAAPTTAARLAHSILQVLPATARTFMYLHDPDNPVFLKGCTPTNGAVGALENGSASRPWEELWSDHSGEDADKTPDSIKAVAVASVLRWLEDDTDLGRLERCVLPPT